MRGGEQCLGSNGIDTEREGRKRTTSALDFKLLLPPSTEVSASWHCLA